MVKPVNANQLRKRLSRISRLETRLEKVKIVEKEEREVTNSCGTATISNVSAKIDKEYHEAIDSMVEYLTDYNAEFVVNFKPTEYKEKNIGDFDFCATRYIMQIGFSDKVKGKIDGELINLVLGFYSVISDETKFEKLTKGNCLYEFLDFEEEEGYYPPGNKVLILGEKYSKIGPEPYLLLPEDNFSVFSTPNPFEEKIKLDTWYPQHNGNVTACEIEDINKHLESISNKIDNFSLEYNSKLSELVN